MTMPNCGRVTLGLMCLPLTKLRLRYVVCAPRAVSSRAATKFVVGQRTQVRSVASKADDFCAKLAACAGANRAGEYGRGIA